MPSHPAIAPELDGVVRVDVGDGGLDVVVVDGALAQARISLQGAQVLRFQARGHDPLLFVSAKSAFAPGKAIRGGIPVCFPWFGAHSSERTFPSHGFARVRAWELTEVVLRENDHVLVRLTLRDDEATRALWPHAFRCTVDVDVGDVLAVTFTCENTGDAPFSYEVALHSYLAVADVEQVQLHGLSHTPFIDKVDGGTLRTSGAGPVVLSGETDRVFQGTKAGVTVIDDAGGRSVHVDKQGSSSTVVWNPWLVQAQRMPDVGGDAWRRFVCVEAAAVGKHAITLSPRAHHALVTRLRSHRTVPAVQGIR